MNSSLVRSLILILLLFCVGKSQQISRDGADSSTARTFYEKGSNLLKAARYDSAIVLFEKAESLYLGLNTSADRVRCLTKKAECLELKGSYDKALAALQIAPRVEQALLTEAPIVAADRLVMMGGIYRLQGKYDSALTAARSAESIQHEKSTDNIDLQWDIYSLLAGTYFNAGEHDSAIVYHSRALLLFPNPRGDEQLKVSATYNDIAGIYESHGDYQKALNYYTQSLDLRRHVLGEKHPDISNLYNNIAAIHMRLGDFDVALEYYFKSLAIMNEIVASDHPTYGIRYNNIAMVYRSKGEFGKALEMGSKSKEIFVKKLGARHPNVAGVVNNIGRTYSDMKQYDRALESYQEALSIWEEKLGPKHPNVAQSYFNIGEAYGNLRQREKALFWLQKSLNVRRETLGEKNVKVAQSYNGLGAVFAASKDLDSALVCYQNGIISLVASFDNTDIRSNPDTLSSPSDLDLLGSLAGKANVLRTRYDSNHQTSDLTASLDTYDRAAQLVEKIRRGFGTEGSKILLGQTSFDVYERGIETAWKLVGTTHNAKYLSTAFVLAERSKAGVLLDAISESHARKFAGIPDSLLAQESALRVDLAYHDAQLQREKDKRTLASAKRIGILESSLFDARRKYEALIDGFERNYPDYHLLKLEKKVPSLNDIQGFLPDEKSAVLEYVLGDSTVSIFVVAKKRVTLRVETAHSPIIDLVKKFRHAVQTLDDRAYLDAGYELYTELLAPIRLELKGIKKLFVIPDGILNYLPFESLLTHEVHSSPVEFSALPFVIRDFDVSYDISARLLVEQNRKSESARGYLGIAPIFADRQRHADTVLISVAHSASFGSPEAKQVLRSRTIDGENYAELKESENEVKGILKLFEAKGQPAKVVLNSAATESELKSRQAGTYRFIHIATHGFVNEEKPELSGIVFASPAKGSTEDGILYSGEIYNLSLNADLVVLSACESGLGTIAKGEGILGLTRGFMYGGARNLLVSLWQVADKSTSILMVDFYRNILRGQTYSAALRNAKLSMIAGKKFAHPSEWSPFVLTGQ